MKRSYDDILNILSALEEHQGAKGLVDESTLQTSLRGEGLTASDAYQLKLLRSEQYIEQKISGDGPEYGLTWKGHDLLDSLRAARDPRKVS